MSRKERVSDYHPLRNRRIEWRRWISAARWRESYEGHWEPHHVRHGKFYHLLHGEWTEYVVVPDGDPRAETWEPY